MFLIIWHSVEYHKNQDPYLLYTGSHNFTIHSLIALSCDGHTVAIASALSVSVYNTHNGEEEERLNDVHTGESVLLLEAIFGYDTVEIVDM